MESFALIIQTNNTHGKFYVNFKGGHAFTNQPHQLNAVVHPENCLLAADYFRMHNMADRTKCDLSQPREQSFWCKVVADSLMKVIQRYNIDFKPFYSPIKIDGPNRKITFKHTGSWTINVSSMKMVLKTSSQILIKSSWILICPFGATTSSTKICQRVVIGKSSRLVRCQYQYTSTQQISNIFGLGDVAAQQPKRARLLENKCLF